MKILQVITSLHIGGAERLISEMVPLFCEDGYQVDVLLFDGEDTPFKKKLQESGIKVYQFGNRCSVYNPLFIIKLIPFFKRYDIIHTHNTACQYFVALAKFISRSKVKLLTTEHNTTNRRRDICWFKPIDKFIYAQYDAVISVSDMTSLLLKNYLGNIIPIYTIYNGINLLSYRHASQLEKKEIKKLEHVTCLITMVAAFREQKDQDTLIRALSLLPTSYGVCFVGDGNRRAICETLSKDLNLYDRVCFLGLRSDIPQILKASDIVVLSSHWEGFGLAVVEGMAAGKPVIASDVPGLAEVVRDAGVLFSIGSEKQLAAEIEHLMNDCAYYKQIADKCMERASEYDICKTVVYWEKVWLSLLND